MTKVFEDYFSELQADMVTICLDYVEDNVDDIYIYCSYEPDMYAFDVFFKVDKSLLELHQVNDYINIREPYNSKEERQFELLDNGTKDLKKIHEVRKKFDRDMPTEMKIHYNVKENSLKADYKYDYVYSNDNDLLPDDIFDKWYEEVKDGLEE